MKTRDKTIVPRKRELNDSLVRLGHKVQKDKKRDHKGLRQQKPVYDGLYFL